MGTCNHHTSEPEAMGRAKAHKHLLWIVGVCVIGLVVWLVGWRDILDAFRNADPWLLILMAFLDAAAIWVRALKWRLVLGPGKQAIWIQFVSKVAGNYSPGRVGELSPLLMRKHRSSRLGAWIIVDRLLEMFVTIALGALGLYMIQFSSASALPLLGLSMLIFVGLPLLALTRKSWFERIGNRTRDGSFVNKIALALVRMSEDIVLLKRNVPAALIVTIAASCLELGALMALYRAFWEPRATFFVMAAARFAQNVIGALPISPGSTGLPQLGVGVFLKQACGFAPETLAAAIISREAISNLIYWVSLGASTPRLWKKDKKEEDSACSPND